MKITAQKNPIISKQGVCDPHLHIFNDKAYLYASHDVPGPHFFDMNDWEIWSSSDLVVWEKESVIRPEETSMGASWECWAVDAAEKNGKYYVYLSKGSTETYVVESEDPGKGWRDPLGYPLLPETLTPTRSYDPTVFTDDDGSSYIIFGTPVWADGDSYYIAKLNDDMISLAEVPRKIELDDMADDKSFLHKYNGVYYLTWASFYATSDNIYGPYTTRGNINLSTDHGSFFEWNEQWFMAFTVDETIDHIRRATGIAYIHYRENGDMFADQLIREYGVGQYNAEWNCIEAEWFMKGHRTSKKENTFGNFDVVLQEGSWVEYPNIHNMPENPILFVHAASEDEVQLDVYEGETFLGTLTKPVGFLKGGEFPKYTGGTLQLPLSAGTHSLRFVAKGNVKINYFRISENR